MRDSEQDYFAQQLTSKENLRANACCDQAPPEHLKPVLSRPEAEASEGNCC